MARAASRPDPRSERAKARGGGGAETRDFAPEGDYADLNSLKETPSMAKSTTPALDAADRRILRALQRDGRLPIVALAEQVGLSPTPCQRRVKRLEEAGIIARYAAVIDPAQVGLPLQAFVQVALSSHAEEVVQGFQRALSARPEVLAAYAMSGEMDYLLHVLAVDFEAYAEFALKALLRMPGVKETKSSFVLAALKAPGDVPV
jgi:Lrp/AsnC family leucine-responsive transcriptional regulator